MQCTPIYASLDKEGGRGAGVQSLSLPFGSQLPLHKGAFRVRYFYLWDSSLRSE